MSCVILFHCVNVRQCVKCYMYTAHLMSSLLCVMPSKCDHESSHLPYVQQQALLVQGIEGLVETSPGVRSCMIEYDQRLLPLAALLETLLKTEQQLPKVHPTRKEQKEKPAPSGIMTGASVPTSSSLRLHPSTCLQTPLLCMAGRLNIRTG